MASTTNPTEIFSPCPSLLIIQIPAKLRKRMVTRVADTPVLLSQSSIPSCYSSRNVLSALLSCKYSTSRRLFCPPPEEVYEKAKGKWVKESEEKGLIEGVNLI